MRTEQNTKSRILPAGATLLLAFLVFAVANRAVDDGYVALLLTGLALATGASFMVRKNGSSGRFTRG